MEHQDYYAFVERDTGSKQKGKSLFASLSELPSAKPDEPDRELADEPSETYTPQEAIEKLGFGRYQLVLFVLTGLMWVADAMEVMLLSFLSDGAQCDWQLCPGEKALLSSLVFAGMLIGAPVWGYVADVAGRKRTVLMIVAVTLAFGVLSALAPYYALLVAARFCVGFGIGGAHVSFNLCAEWLPNQWRGKMLIYYALFWTAGSIAEVLLAWLLMPLFGWRWLLLASALPLAVSLLLVPLLSESPHFLYTKARYDDLHAVFERVCAWNGCTLPGRVLQVRLADLAAADPAAAVPCGQRFARLVSPELRSRTLLLVYIWFVDAAAYYGCFLLVTELFRIRYNEQAAAVVDTCACQPAWTTAEYLTVLWAAVSEAPGVFVAAYLIERIGRTWTQTSLFFVTGIMALFLAIPSGYTSESIFFLVFRSAITSTFQATFACTPELYPTSVRATALGMFASVSRIGAMVAPLISQVLVQFAPALAICLYAVMSLGAGVASTFLPETRGLSMQT